MNKFKTENVVTFLLLLIVITIMISFRSKPQSGSEPVAVIELFTSQGCSSCPAADELLSQTIADAKRDGRKIFALSFHVDYWNTLGWADPFSDKKYSARQNEYATAMNLRSIYTPQAIVNGSTEFTGSDKGALTNALLQSLRTSPKATFKSLTTALSEGNELKVKYDLEGDYAGCKINFALISLKETTSVKRGENSGRVLKNENIVRQFVTVNASASGTISFAHAPMPSKGNMAVVAYVQRNSDLKIIGAEKAEIL